MLIKAWQAAAAALSVCLTVADARAANETTLDCRKSETDKALDFGTLNLVISAAIPPGTVLYSGNMNITFFCSLNSSQRYNEAARAELYFKRKAVDSDVLGYGLTLYTGYGGNLGTAAENIATGKTITGCPDDDNAPFCERITLSIPFQIVKTSTAITAPASLTNRVNIFDTGSEIAGTDLKFFAENIHSGITVTDETCSTTENNLTVLLGSHSLNQRHGLGSGPGATSAATPFTLTLNCEAMLSGTFDVMMQFNGMSVSGFADKGVLALEGINNAASNIGIQLLNGDKEPIVLGIPFNVAAYPLPASIIKVPFYARYYQTGDKAAAGVANSQVTYTLSYQ